MLKLLTANWKLNGSKKFIDDYCQKLSVPDSVDLVICPPAIYLDYLNTQLKNTKIAVGAQNIAPAPSGAYTGEISVDMLFDVGCQYVIIGHSERRSIFSEHNDLIQKKLELALSAGLKVILCIADEKQLAILENFKNLDPNLFSIAYEPIWAIGTGQSASPEIIQRMHKIILGYAPKIKVLYGGSLTPENAPEIFKIPEVSGGLVGGASLKPDSFLKLAKILAES